jgi:hypothetical protein
MAETRRPTSRSSARTVACSRLRAGRRARPPSRRGRLHGVLAGSSGLELTAVRRCDALHAGPTFRARRSARGARRREAGYDGLNDTLAVPAGRSRARVAVVCGAGINCVGVAPDAGTSLPALGPSPATGAELRRRLAVSKAARSFDGRGRRRRSNALVRTSAGNAVRARGAIHHEVPAPGARAHPSCSVEAEADEVAAGIVDQLADRSSRWRDGPPAWSRARVEVLLGAAPQGENCGWSADPYRAAPFDRSGDGPPPIVGARCSRSTVGGGDAQERVRAEVMAAAGTSDG